MGQGIRLVIFWENKQADGVGTHGSQPCVFLLSVPIIWPSLRVCNYVCLQKVRYTCIFLMHGNVPCGTKGKWLLGRVWKNIWHAEGIPPCSAVPMVIWDVEMSWKGVSREEFAFITVLCHHVSFLLSPSASLLSVYHFVAWKKAQSMWRNLRAGCQQPQGHPAKMVISTAETADVALSPKRLFPFRAAQVFVDKAIQVSLTDKLHKINLSCSRAHFMCKRQSAALLQVKAPLFSLVWVFFPLLYKSLTESISHFLHLY